MKTEENQQTGKGNGNALGITAMVSGIISLLALLMPYIGLPMAIIAIVFSNKQKKKEPTGMATAGQVLGIIGIVLNSIMFIILFIGLWIYWAMKGL